jgi:hypothetical protein
VLAPLLRRVPSMAKVRALVDALTGRNPTGTT